MAEITFDALEELDPLNAASLNDRFGEIRNGINDLPSDALAKGALNENHLPTLVTDNRTKRVGSEVLLHSYTSTTYTVITRGGNDLELDFGTDISIGTGTGVGGILVFCEVFMRRLKMTSGANPYSREGAKAFFRISSAPTAAGAYSPLNRTERYVQAVFEATGGGAYQEHAGTSQEFIVPIQTLITSADSSTVRKIKVDTKVEPDPGAPTDGHTLLLRECFLSAIVLRSSKS